MRPYFLQQCNVFAYVGLKKYIWPDAITREPYLSFEDAMWDLLPRLGYKKGSKILVPSFYCVDVVKNIEAHGYKVAWYPLNKDFSYSLSAIRKVVEKEAPDVFIDLDVAGIPMGLGRKILKHLHLRTLLLSDRVHTLLHPSLENFPQNDRHLIITSNRKVTPFTGAVALYTRNARSLRAPPPWKYILEILYRWNLVIFGFSLAQVVNIKKLGLFAEKQLRITNDLVGDSFGSAKYPRLVLEIYDRFPIEKIWQHKNELYALYYTGLKLLVKGKKNIWFPKYMKRQPENLRGFPLILSSRYAPRFIRRCRDLGFLTKAELDNPPWSKKYALVFLPMGLETKIRDAQAILKIVKEALLKIK